MTVWHTQGSGPWKGGRMDIVDAEHWVVNAGGYDNRHVTTNYHMRARIHWNTTLSKWCLTDIHHDIVPCNNHSVFAIYEPNGAQDIGLAPIPGGKLVQASIDIGHGSVIISAGNGHMGSVRFGAILEAWQAQRT